MPYFIYSSVGRHLDYFRTLAIMNNAAMNNGVQISLQVPAFNFFRYIIFRLQTPNIKENLTAAAAAAKSLQSCLTLCNPIDGSPPGSPVPGILQARTLEWVAISFSNAGK